MFLHHLHYHSIMIIMEDCLFPNVGSWLFGNLCFLTSFFYHFGNTPWIEHRVIPNSDSPNHLLGKKRHVTRLSFLKSIDFVLLAKESYGTIKSVTQSPDDGTKAFLLHHYGTLKELKYLPFTMWLDWITSLMHKLFPFLNSFVLIDINLFYILAFINISTQSSLDFYVIMKQTWNRIMLQQSNE